MKKQRNYLLYFFFAILISTLLFNCSLFVPPQEVDPTAPPITEPTVTPTSEPTSEPTVTPTPEPENLTGYWKSIYGDGFEIISSATDLFYQYDNDTKNISFAGEIVNNPDYTALAGYITLRITDSGTWGKTIGEYYVIHWKNLSGDAVQEACAYKTDGAGTLPTQAEAEAEYTVENDYFTYYADYKRQLEIKMPVPSVFMDIFPQNAVISFESTTTGAVIYTGISSDELATDPDSWVQNSDLTLDAIGIFKIFARSTITGMGDSVIFSEIINVASEFLPAAEQPESDAISMDDLSIVAWASGYENYIVGEDCDNQWQTPDAALGQAVGDSYDIVCLGNGGEITLTFTSPITDGPGPDFVIFENSINDTLLEFAYVEVSSNGTDFVRFDCTSLTESQVEAFGSINPKDVNGLASKYKQGFGTSFDLSYLKYRKEVCSGTVNLTNITCIRLIDIWGNPDSGITDYDSFGNIIYDPYRCVGSGGFDLDAIGVLNKL